MALYHEGFLTILFLPTAFGFLVDRQCGDSLNIDCAAFIASGTCDTASPTVIRNCPRTCGLCPSESSTTPVPTSTSLSPSPSTPYHASLQHIAQTTPTSSLAPTTTQRPTTGSTLFLISGCTDSPIINCADLDSASSICSIVTYATSLYCPVYCGLCVPAFARHISTTPTTTTVSYTLPDPCVDSPRVDCSALDSNMSICNPVTMATTLYCPSYCNLCITTTTPIPTSVTTHLKIPDPCVDSSRVDCSVLDRNMSICNPVTMATTLFCPLYCGLCITTTPTPTTTFSACVDSEFVDCAGLDAAHQICSEPNNPTTNTFCVRYCGLCPS